ncbi:deoxyribonuclease IV [Candidatus Zixiibacteriota bacterium]
MIRKVTEEPGPAVEATGGLQLGSHMSVAGGVSLAFARAERVGCAVAQIFVKNNNRWRGARLITSEIDSFWSERERTGIWPVIAHNTYLVNLASADPAIRERSIACTVDELKRCQYLGLPGLVMHPGAHLGAGVEEGARRVKVALHRVFDRTPDVSTRVLLETTAGQGSTLGRSAEELALLLEMIGVPDRTGVCLDSCHIFAAGYELRTARGYKETIRIFDETVGLDQIRAIHLNDSKKPLGSLRDRHEHIGRGEIGDAGFRNIMNDMRLRNIPMILETPKEGDADLLNLARLRKLAVR